MQLTDLHSRQGAATGRRAGVSGLRLRLRPPGDGGLGGGRKDSWIWCDGTPLNYAPWSVGRRNHPGVYTARCARLGFDIGRGTISHIETGLRGVSDLEM